jgi:WD40 repeat protein
LSANGRFFVTEDPRDVARVWDSSTLRRIATVDLTEFRDELGQDPGFVALPISADVRPDGKALAILEFTARVVDLRTGRAIAALKPSGPSSAPAVVAFSRDGRYVVTTNEVSIARVWDPKTGRTVARLRHTNLVDADFSADGTLIATAGARTVRVWDVLAGRQVAEMTATGYLETVRLSPDGQFAVTTDVDELTVSIWEAMTGEPVMQLPRGAGRFSDASVSPDGRFIVAAGRAGAIWIYPCDVCGSLAELVTVARTRVTRELTPEEREKYLHGA